jgi:hypothetical protein
MQEQIVLLARSIGVTAVLVVFLGERQLFSLEKALIDGEQISHKMIVNASAEQRMTRRSLERTRHVF